MKNNNIQEEIIEEVETESVRVDKNDLDTIISAERKVYTKSSTLDSQRFSRFIKQMKLAISLVKDFRNKSYTDVPWRSIAMIAVGVMYFINPFDMVPDMLPLFGIADDAMLFAAVFKSIQTDLEKYGQWKGINTEDYF